MSKKHYKNLPKRIKIGQRDIKVVTRTEQTDLNLTDNYAYTPINWDYIFIQKGLPVGQLRSTLLHEIIHAINNVFSNAETKVPARHKGESDFDYKGRHEHALINVIDEGLVMVLRDNPHLVEYLTS
jgi:hypothetical protein